VNTHIRPANLKFGNVELRKCYLLGRVVFWVDGALALELAVCVRWMEVQLYLFVSSVSEESVRFDFGKEGIRPCHLDKALPVVFLLQPSSFYAQETQNPPSSHIGPSREVS